jgi:tetratricopeptide (TPR) repeat protein
MRVITFYSFKGGVGRTQLLLNVACIVAARGKNVALVDMDIHAPGLSFMKSLRPKDGEAPPGGLIDFFESVVAANGRADAEIADLTACAYEPPLIREKLRARAKDAGNLWLIPCADFHGPEKPEEARAGYLKQLDQLAPSLQRLAARSRKHALSGAAHANPILSEMEEQLAELTGDHGTPDFLFIDARTGFTEISDMILCHGVSHLVLVSGLNEQNQTGLDLALSELSQRGNDGWRQHLSIALSLIPWGEDEAVQKAVQEVKDLLRRHADGSGSLFGGEGTRDPFRIPYHPRLAVTDSPIVLDFPESPLSQVYEECADHLAPEVRRGEVLPLLTRFPLEERRAKTSPRTDRPSLFTNTPAWHLFVKPDSIETVRRQLFPESEEAKGVTADAFLNAVWNDLQKDSESKEQILKSVASLSSFQLSETIRALAENRKAYERMEASVEVALAAFLALRWWEWREVMLRCGVASSHLQSIPETLQHLRPEPGALSHGRFWTRLAEAMRAAGDPAWLSVLTIGHLQHQDDPDFVTGAATVQCLGRENATAVAWLRGILERRRGSLTEPQLAELHYWLGECLRFENDPAGAREALKHALELHTAAKDALGQANDHRSLGHAALSEADLAGARHHYDRSLELHTEAGDTLQQAYDHSSLGHVDLREDDLAGARLHYERALELHTAAKNTWWQTYNHRKLGGVALRQGDLAGARHHYGRARELHTEAGDTLGQANDHRSLGDVALREDDLTGARDHYDRALALHTAAKDTLGQANDHRSLGDVALREDDLTGARHHYERALELHIAAKDTLGQANDHGSLGDVALREDDLAGAREHYDRALELHTAAKDTRGQANDHKGLAECLVREQLWDEALTALDACLVRYQSLGDQEGLRETQLLISEACHGKGDNAKSDELINEVVAWAESRGFKLLQRQALDLQRKLFPAGK